MRLIPCRLCYVLAAVSTAAGVARASDFATRVVSSANLAAPWNNPTNALGRPTVDAWGDWENIDPAEPVPVVPAYPPIRLAGFGDLAGDYLVSIDTGGHLTLEFDHQVEDDPRNPYGLDLIVFGNMLHSGRGQAWSNRDPNAFTLGATHITDAGRVSVSQDGVTWLTYTNGPYADDFAPTLGRVYDPTHAVTNLGAWNRWWGSPTDPTRPHDPRLKAADYDGRTLAEVCRAYGTSAGGTGFDLAVFADLPATSSNGCKWIRFVRIASTTLAPEVDAVSDVAPVAPFELWRLALFTWWQLADPALSGAAADPGRNGQPNWVDYAFAGDPWTVQAPVNAIRAAAWRRQDGADRLAVTYTRNASARDVTFRLESAGQPGRQAAWSAADVVQEARVETLSNGLEAVTGLLPPGVGPRFARLRTLAP